MEFVYTQEGNVLGPLLWVKHAAPHLRASDRGSVVNVGSIGGERPYRTGRPTAAFKIALVGLTRTLASELGRDD